MSAVSAAVAAAAAAALTDALVALRRAEQAVNEAMAYVASETPPAPPRHYAAKRTTGTQILSVLAAAGEPLTLIDIADGVVAMRRDEDEPKPQGGTRYQELCRTSIGRLIERGLVERVPPADKRGLMRFRRTAVKDPGERSGRLTAP